MKFKKAIILSAGFGKRLKPLTDKIPKPLLKINNITLLENTLRFLKKMGVEEIAINVHYLAEQVIHFLKSVDNEYNIKIFKEEKILGTGGGILNCLPYFLNEKFIAINCDTVWNSEYESPLNILSAELEKEKAHIGLLVIEKNRSFDKRLGSDFSRDTANPNLLIRNDKTINYLIYTGFQIIDPKVFKEKKLTTFSMNEIWDKAMKERKLVGQTQADFTTFYHVSDYEIYKKIKNQKITNF